MPDPAPPLRVALVAPPTQTVPPSALGGLDQVRWLADGLAARGHQVTLVGAGLHGFVAERYQVLDTDQHLATRPDPELADAWHAKAAGEIVELLDIDTVSDHTLTGYQPAGGHLPPTAWTFYQPAPPPPPGGQRPAGLPAQLGLVAVSLHQQRPATWLPWWDVLHPPSRWPSTPGQPATTARVCTWGRFSPAGSTAPGWRWTPPTPPAAPSPWPGPARRGRRHDRRAS